MSARFLRILFALIASGTLHAAPPAAQEAPVDPELVSHPGLAELRARYAKSADAQERLYELLMQILEEDTGLADRLRSVRGAYVKTMAGLDPESTQRRARLAQLGEAYHRALLDEDTERAAELVAEGFELLQALRATANAAAREPELAKRIKAFRTEIAARLGRRDASAVRTLARHDLVMSLILVPALGLP